MTLVAPNIGEITLLKYIVNMTAPTDPVMKLYTNNYTPVEDSSIGNFTEAVQAGYTPHTLANSVAPALWTITEVGGTTTAVYSEVTFTFTTNANVYGYYVVSTGGTLLWAEEFSGSPFALPTGGGTIAISPRLELA